ncbi:imidazole glycerol phosphate synthase subunit HisF [Sphingorhabdus contaminans]|uniref:Imidazole glycerol phosphate synthase subunit HisF n=1 Tax=Sphingorhabdus contaminans TaxID=1343899 RepID=A0A553WD78_9SPHN|nr:imidazole glycerol phosphate synthase subunit HisF [Sphingorhabdus contaminans]
MQRPFRIIARLDVKGPNLIKGVHLEGLRVIGAPQVYAKRYYEQGADELIYMDIVASLYGRSNLLEIVKQTAHDVFVPLTVGGGIRCLDDVTALLRAGADKVAINTAAVHRPKLIEEVARKFGSQCMVLSIEAKRRSDESWEVYTDCGRERSGISVIEWVQEAVELGVGEILLTSIDQEGTRKGFDLRLLEAVHAVTKVPVIISGGYGQSDHIIGAIEAGADAVAVADALHYNRTDMQTLHHIAQTTTVTVRTL